LKGKDKKMTATTHHCKDPNNHYNHCNIDGHTKDKHWKLHPELNPKIHKKDVKKNNLIGMNLSNKVEGILDVDEKIVCTSMQKEVNSSSLHHKEEKEMKKLFHIKIQVKNSKVDALFDFGSQANPIASNLVNKIALEVHDHLSPYPSRRLNKDAKLKVMN
jgi:hypothetical protein